MKTITICCFALIMIGATLLADSAPEDPEIFAPAKLKLMADDIAEVLAEHLQRRTGRKDVAIQLEIAKEQQAVCIMPGKRNSREILFSLRIIYENPGYRIECRSRTEAELAALRSLLTIFLNSDNITWDLDAGMLGYGIVAVPCADLYVDPIKKRGDNLASQLLQGTPLIIWEVSNDKQFLRVESNDDGYLGWLAQDSLFLVTAKRWHHWANMPKVYLGSFLDKPVTLYPGTALAFSGKKLLFCQSSYHYETVLVDPKSYRPFLTKTTAAEIVKTARRFLASGDLSGITYLWGGTCVPQLDCSGFVQTVFRLNNILLPRDADQQLQFAQQLTQKQMRAGDLIFFSKHRRHPTHVGIYLGAGQYIHCSSNGKTSGVKINNLQGKSQYDMALAQIYYGAGRIIR